VAAYGRKFEKLLEALIARFVREGRFQFRPGVGARDLTELVTVASKGVKAAHAGEGEARYARALARMVEVICAGVSAPAGKSAKGIQRTRTARRVAR
jgi:hypothetical protein